MPLHQVSGRSQLGLGLSLVTVLLWGFLAIALQIVLQELDPFTVTWFRFTLSGILLAIYLASRRRLPTWQKLRKMPLPIFLVAVLGLSTNYILFLTGLGKTSASNAQIITQIAPVIMGIASLVIFKEKFSYKQWLGMAILIAGMLLFSHEQVRSLVTTLDTYLWGNCLLVLGAIAWAFYGLAQKQLLLNLPSTSVMLCLYIGATVIFSPLAHPDRILGLSGLHLAALIFCAFNTLIAYGAFAAALEHWQASKVSMVITLSPLVTIAASAALSSLAPQLFITKPLSALAYIGAIAVIGGSIMIILGSHKSNQAKD